MKPPDRRLSPEEMELWTRVARTVRPFKPPRAAVVKSDPASASATDPPPAPSPPGKQAKRIRVPQLAAAPPPPARPARSLDGHTLDAHWDRKLARGLARPDFTIDLHGASLDGAYVRLDQGLASAVAGGARLVLLITGRPQGEVDPVDRASRRGAIRAKFLDWLAQGSHASSIVSIRPAHPRHGGIGAVYIILRKAR